MEQCRKSAPIGVFDSGVGGISVLKELCALMPGERFIFFGDRANAPYGNRSSQEVLALTRDALGFFRREGCKAMVIACNTATGVAADALRAENPDFPIVAIEPALKPAALAHPGEHVVLMATPLATQTLRIQNLAERFSQQAEITLLPCPGLVELIEEGHLQDRVISDYLQALFAPLSFLPAAVVLGCTHYPHIKKALREHLGKEVALYDGGSGTARRMAEILKERDLAAPEDGEGSVIFRFSAGGEEILSLAEALMQVS